MKLMKEADFSGKSPRAENLLVNRVKALSGLLSRRAGFFLLFNILYGFVFSAHFAQFFRFSLEQEYSPHFSLILLVSLYLMYIRGQTLCTGAAYGARGGVPLAMAGILCY